MDLDGNCIHDNNGIFSSKNQLDEEIFYGGVPAISLDLSNNYISDSWRYKIVYVIPKELTKASFFQKLIFDRAKMIEKEYVKDGIIYLLISFNRNNQGAFPYDSDKSNPFSGIENNPTANFTININNQNQYFFYKTLSNLNISEFEEDRLNCPADDSTEIEGQTITFPEGKFGEIVFSNEFCPTQVTSEPTSGDFYYLSTYTHNNAVIDNRPAKKCGRFGKWEDGFVYECVELPKCSSPASVDISKDWSRFNFPIVNLGVVQDEDATMQLKCVVTNGVASWHEVN
jgi:hypothetical protein